MNFDDIRIRNETKLIKNLYKYVQKCFTNILMLFELKYVNLNNISIRNEVKPFKNV